VPTDILSMCTVPPDIAERTRGNDCTVVRSKGAREGGEGGK
jgi:hypothetical protein